MKYIVPFVFMMTLWMSVTNGVLAGGYHGRHQHESISGLPTVGTDCSEGEVTRVEKEKGKLFIKHGDMKRIGMLAMVMVFDVRDPTMLDQISAGDKVRFTVERNGGQLTIVELDRMHSIENTK